MTSASGASRREAHPGCGASLKCRPWGPSGLRAIRLGVPQSPTPECPRPLLPVSPRSHVSDERFGAGPGSSASHPDRTPGRVHSQTCPDLACFARRPAAARGWGTRFSRDVPGPGFRLGSDRPRAACPSPAWFGAPVLETRGVIHTGIHSTKFGRVFSADVTSKQKCDEPHEGMNVDPKSGPTPVSHLSAPIPSSNVRGRARRGATLMYALGPALWDPEGS